MKKLKLTLLMLIVTLFIVNINAQNTSKAADWCQTDKNYEEMILNNPALIQDHINFRQEIRSAENQNTSAESHIAYIIPVVFHVITDNGAGYVSKANIDGVMQTLNEDFKRTNADASNTRSQFLPYVASSDIEFRLAHLDPNNNCTEGIVRIDSPLGTEATNAVKSVSYWDSKKYMNIWVVNSIGGAPPGGGIIAGYAQFPWSGINSTYGIVINYNFVRANNRTLTHEVGHCFSILHPFQSGCGNNCSNSGDWICDTPPSATSSFGCMPTSSTCSNDGNGPSPYLIDEIDQSENFMSYNNCQNMWSLDQMSDMEGVLNSTNTTTGLAQLNTIANRAATGVADPYNPADCPPISEFTYNKEFICEGESITFSEDSYNYNGVPTSWNWTFTGGTPNVSSVPNPTITYNTKGIYNVTYESANSLGSSGSITKTSIITVSSLSANYNGAVVYDFENGSYYNNDWIVNNPSGAGWERNATASVSGSNSISLGNFDTNVDGEIDEIISPSFNMASVSTKNMTFKQAFAKKTSADTDRLFVYSSINCGESWSFAEIISSTILPTINSTQLTRFVPGAGDWVTRTVNLNSISNATNVRFKFRFESGGGNDLYIDDVNIGNGSVGVKDFNNIANFSIYPNPTNASAKIAFSLLKDVKHLSITVRNAVGQEVTSVINDQPFSVGEYTLKIDEERKLASGIYFVEFNTDGNVKIQKLIVQ